MVGKVEVKSYESVSSQPVRRKCPKCRKIANAELVDYGKGGKLLFCKCGSVREVKK